MQITDPILTIATHAHCADGVASALILRDICPDARVLFLQHGTPELAALRAEPGMIFCDFTPPRERVAEFVDAGAYVLDHHAGARDVVERFGERGVYADEPGVSGAVLAFREVWEPAFNASAPRLPHRQNDADTYRFIATVRRFADDVGIRDTWQKGHPRWSVACDLSAGLRFLSASWSWIDERAAIDTKVTEARRIGLYAAARQVEGDAQIISEAYRFDVNDLRVATFNDLRTSDVAERLANEADLVIGWHYAAESNGEFSMRVSCRSKSDKLTALRLAKAHGGSGHEHAAGFVLRSGCHGDDPYSVIRCCVFRGLAIR